MEAGTAARSGWLQRPCAFHLLRSYATKCCACEEKFLFLSRGYTCDFCGHFCHNTVHCSRKMWLPRELLRRRICRKCDTYRKISGRLLTGTDFVLYNRSSCKDVTLSLSESAGEVFLLEKGTDKKLESISLSHTEAIQKGFSHGGHMRAANYDPLKSLSIVVRKSRRRDSMKTYNLKAPKAWLCQMWVDGLQAAKYVHRRMQEQQLAKEWYESKGRSQHQAGGRLFRNYLPRNSELKKFREEKRRAETLNSHTSTYSADSGVDSEGDPVDLEEIQRENYIDIEVQPGSQEVVSREITPSPLLVQRRMSPRTRALTLSQSTPTTPSQTRASISSSPLPIPDDLVSRSTPGLPYAESPLSSLCSCHAYQIVTTSISRQTNSDGVSQKRSSASSSPLLSYGCCPRCEGHCRAVLDLENL